MSDVSLIAGGPNVPPPLPNGDGETVTVADPIGALISTDLGTDTTILLEGLIASAAYPAGTPVYPNADGVHITQCEANSLATSGACVGLLSAPCASGGPVVIRDRGLIKLTAAQWNTLTGGSSGLTPGAIYYISAATAGKLTSTAPSGSNSVVKTLVAITATLAFIRVDLVTPGSTP